MTENMCTAAKVTASDAADQVILFSPLIYYLNICIYTVKNNFCKP